MPPIGTRAHRAKHQVRRIEEVLAGVPAFANSSRRLASVMQEHFPDPDDVMALPEDRLLHPELYGAFDGEPEYEALLVCCVELRASGEFDAAIAHLLTLRPDYEGVATRMAAG